ncbi:hypothetical protein BG004_007922, partial [Podila humilis]
MAATASASPGVTCQHDQTDRFGTAEIITPTTKSAAMDYLPRIQALEHSHRGNTHSHHQPSNQISPTPPRVLATADALFQAIHHQNHTLTPHAQPFHTQHPQQTQSEP